MVDMDEFKEVVKQSYISKNGEDAYYKDISERLDTLIYMKNSIENLQDWGDMTNEDKKTEFKRGIIDAIVEDCNFSEEEMLYNIAMDVFNIFE